MNPPGAKPHVVHIIKRPTFGGVQFFVYGLATSAALEGYRQSVLCLEAGTGPLTEMCRAAGIDLHTVEAPTRSATAGGGPGARLQNAAFLLRLFLKLRSMHADLVHTHNATSIDLQAKTALHLLRVPFVWTMLDTPPRVNLNEGGRYRKVGELIRRSGRGRVTVVSKAVEAHFAPLWAAEHLQPIITYCGVDRRRIDTTAQRSDAYREQMGVPKGGFVFGCVGRLSEEKGQDLLIEAAGLLVAEGHDIHVAFAGDGPTRPALEAKIGALGLEGRVHLLGYRADVGMFLRNIDVFVMPSVREGFPLSLVEALTMGVPAIVTPVGGMPEALEAGGGIVLPERSAEALAGAMRQMLDRDVREKFAREAPSVGEQFDIENTAAVVAGLYESLIQC